MKSCCISASKLLTALMLAFSFIGIAQTTSLSPYSRFGIGTILSQGSAVQHSLGGNTAGYVNHFAPNLENPASYAFMYNTAFDVGLRGTSLTLNNGSESSTLNVSSLSHFALVFKRQGGNMAFGLGLVPYSTTGYSITDQQTFDDIGDVSFTYDGEGGFNRANAGLAYRFDFKRAKGILDKSAPADSASFRHNISLGANLNYFFGSLHQIRRVLYADAAFYHSRIRSSTSISDVNLNIGGQALLRLKNKYQGKSRVAKTDLMLGAAYTLGSNMNSEFEEISETVRYSAGAEIVVDTAGYVSGVEGTLTFPSSINAGLGIVHVNKNDREFVWTGNFFSQDWSSFSGQFGLDDDSQSLGKAQSISVGFQYTPKPLGKSNKAFQRATYYFGGRTTDTYLTLADQQISEMAISTGFSLPMLKSKTFPPSKLNFGTEFGTRGTTTDNLIEETFVNVFVGFTLTPHIINNWFVQRKYD